jgi:uncharacterized protein (UPF0212 family)
MFEPEYLEIEASCSSCTWCGACVSFPGIDTEVALVAMTVNL